MPHRLTAPLLALILLARFVAPAVAQEQPPAKGGEAEKPKQKDGPGGSDKLSTTEHEVEAGRQKLKYRATAGTLAMKDEAGKHKADFFFVGYERLADNGKPLDPARRPVTFVFNGGPGAAAVWLHLGTAGPKRVKLNEAGDVPPPPYQVVDNGSTWLDATDLVFIDPVGTGFSRPAPGEKQEQFSGVQEDIQSVGEFIRLYLTRNNRWPSPKFLAGESYGTTRAAGLSEHLAGRGIALNGIIFVSTVLQFQTISFGQGNELPFALYLPTYTAAAWYHAKLANDLQADLPKALKEAERWATDVYLPALAKGSSLSPDERAAVAKRLSRYTSIPAATVEKANLRIDPGLFRKEVLADKRQLVGRFDARLGGYDPDPLSRYAEYDPSLTPYLAAYTGAFNEYVRRALRFETDLSYEVLSGRVQPWNYGRAGSGYLDVSDNLQNAMRENPHLKVLFASGLYDLATPYFGTNYTVNHLDLSPSLRANITETFYEGGHMMYHYRPALEQLHADVKAFIEKAAGK